MGLSVCNLYVSLRFTSINHQAFALKRVQHYVLICVLCLISEHLNALCVCLYVCACVSRATVCSMHTRVCVLCVCVCVCVFVCVCVVCVCV